MGVRFILHTEQAYLRQVEGVNIADILWIDTLNGHVDVRLSRTKPYITHEYIGQLHFFTGCTFTAHFHRIWSSGLLLRQVNLPAAVSTCRRRINLLAESDGNLFAGIGLTPNGNGLVALKHHARLEQLWKLNFGSGCHTARKSH